MSELWQPVKKMLYIKTALLYKVQVVKTGGKMMEFCGHLELTWTYEYTEFAGYLDMIISTEFCRRLTMP